MESYDRLKAQMEEMKAAQTPTELQTFTAMLDRIGIGHGLRHDHNPDGTAVMVEHDADDDETAPFWITQWAFDEAGRLTGVTHSEGEIG